MVKPYYEEVADGIPRVQIFLGDCEEILPEISGVNAVVTSPPYNTLDERIPTEGTNLMAGNQWLEKVNEHGYDDSMPEDEYEWWQIEIARLLWEACVPGASFFYNHKLRYRDGEILHPLELVRQFEGWPLQQELIWDRTIAMAFNSRRFAPSEERIYWMVRSGAKHTWNQEAAKHMSVWRISPLKSDGQFHPCPYPDQLVQRCLIGTTNRNDLVLDPFLGSGTTMRVAKDLGLRCIGIEKREDFAELAVKRMAQEVLF